MKVENVVQKGYPCLHSTEYEEAQEGVGHGPGYMDVGPDVSSWSAM